MTRRGRRGAIDVRYVLALLRDWGVAAIVVLAAFLTWQWITTPMARSDGPAPEFTLPAVEGGDISLASYGDDLVVLNFWFTDCGPCRSEIPELAKWHTANPEVPLVGVSVDRIPPQQLKTRAAQLGVNYPIAHDQYGRVAASYGVSVFPTTMVVKGGEIRLMRVGQLDIPTLQSMVDRVSQGR